MKRISFQFLMLLFIPASVLSQDTTWIQTLTFDSITARRGVWQFPENEEHRKILMYYTLKCDQATAHDNFPCGEWDYLTYTNIHEHTGRLDSTLYYQESLKYINNQSIDTLNAIYNATYEYYRNNHQYPIYNDTISIENIEIGEGLIENHQIFDLNQTDGKSQYIWKAQELSDLGFTQGPITGVKINLKNSVSEIRHFTLKLGQTNQNEITPYSIIKDLDRVYYNSVEVSEEGWYNINFTETFEWDGESNLVLEFSFENDHTDTPMIVLSNELDWNGGVTSSATNYSINLDGEMDYIKLANDVYFQGDFTFEAWLNKHSDNNWSRIIDFGNGPGKDNVIIALSKQTTGLIYVSIRRGDSERHYTLNDDIVTDEWFHLAFALEGILGKIYINGELAKFAPLFAPEEIVREYCYIGKSNWNNDAYADLSLDDFKIFSRAKTELEIYEDMMIPIADPLLEEDLVVYYDFNGSGSYVMNDLSGNDRNAQAFGLPQYEKIKGPDFFTGFSQNNFRPTIIFERIETENQEIISTIVMDSIALAPNQILVFEDGDNVTIPVDTLEIWREGYTYIYQAGQIYDSVFFAADEQLIKIDIPYYGEPFEVVNKIEMARYITPYGINLDLGPQGFTWIYDVTDFAHLLKSDVDLSSGNQQELIDLKFAMIKGTPPRDMIKLDTIWGYKRSYRYDHMDNDEVLSARTIDLEAVAERFKVITRLSGHGHQSNTGEYPHCCEWKDNTHYLYVNDQEAANWHIFQYNDCALNPVYPQGGTWVGAREGWCPGDVVKDFEFDITEHISNSSVTLDYDITDVPENNPGMGSGNYVTAMFLAQYGPANFEYDAEVYDVITPNTWEYYSRKNPICSDPKIIIRNNGEEKLTSLLIRYGVSGGIQQEYEWVGNLESMHKEIVTLPASESDFWMGDTDKIFTVSISNPNNHGDEYEENNQYSTHFVMPDLHQDNFVLRLKMNKEPERFHLSIKNAANEVVYSIENFVADSLYNEQLDLDQGCYTMELLDDENIGLS
ncbi:MAG: hypothetical protein JEZ03_09805, partial [Bacteroidales bacterium]|nr:hypothetical protein [Bacteroidales bacterium]